MFLTTCFLALQRILVPAEVLLMGISFMEVLLLR